MIAFSTHSPSPPTRPCVVDILAGTVREDDVSTLAAALTVAADRFGKWCTSSAGSAE